MVRVSDVLREALPDLVAPEVRVIETGWDNQVLEVDGAWIIRLARNEWALEGQRIEARLLPRLAATLPLQIPVPLRGGEGWTLTRRIDGTAVDAQVDAGAGSRLASFLRALHAFPIAEARALDVRDERRAVNAERFRRLVLPLLDRDERPVAERLLDACEHAVFQPTLVHGDLGPDHILVEDGRITGVIDWTDACIGDPAIDLAWALHGAPAPFAATVAETYGVDETFARRALVHHALGPWHEVVEGLRGDPQWVQSGLAGVRARLPSAAEGAGTMDE